MQYDPPRNFNLSCGVGPSWLVQPFIQASVNSGVRYIYISVSVETVAVSVTVTGEIRVFLKLRGREPLVWTHLKRIKFPLLG